MIASLATGHFIVIVFAVIVLLFFLKLSKKIIGTAITVGIVLVILKYIGVF